MNLLTTEDQTIYPISAILSADGSLTIAGSDPETLARDFGTPLYLYDGQTVRSNIQTLQRLLKEHYPAAGAVAYAAKAYFSKQFAAKLAGQAIEVDVVSLAELVVALKAGFAPEQIHFHGNNKTAEEIRQALDLNIHALVIDSLDELAFVEKIAAEKKKTVRIWLRITPDIRVQTHPHIETSAATSKFGFHVITGEAEQGIRAALASPHFELCGLHCHLGSQLFDPVPYAVAIEMLYTLAAECGYEPQEISPGGGWGVRYTKNDPLTDPQDWIQTISRAVQEQCERTHFRLPKIVIEPGRWLAARAGVAIYRIGSRKKTPDGKHILAVDGGMSDNPRHALYQAAYSAMILNKVYAKNLVPTTVVGKFCESGDVLIDPVDLPEAGRDDLLIIPVSGAYQLSMASNYNLAPRPAVLWLEPGGGIELLQRRENSQESSWWV